jgi:hypothetical protein
VEHRIDAGLLWGRAAVVGLLAFGLGVLGHVSADGLLPGSGILVGLAVVSVLFSVPMLTSRASTVRLVALVVGGQTATHLSLSLAAGHAGDARPVRSTHLDGYAASLPVVDGHRVGSLLDAYRTAAEPVGSTAPVLPVGHLLNDLSAHAPMMAAHLAASAIVGFWLAYGEHCLWTVLALTGRRLLTTWAAQPLVLISARRLVTVVDDAPDRPRASWRGRPCSRRGPPVLLVA